MLAAVYHDPLDIRIEEVKKPEVGPGEVLIAVEQASICGTDMRIYHGGHRKFPAGTVRIPGHEVVGRIAATGAGVEGYAPGQRVFAAPNWGCGRCKQCISGNHNRCAQYGAIGITQDGAFAEYFKLPALAVMQGNILPISEEVNGAQAALIEPFACVLRGQTALHIFPGERVLVMGAGPIGIMHMKLALASGAGEVWVSEPSPLRREQAQRLGASQVLNPQDEDLPEQVLQMTQGQGMDVIIVAAPAGQAQVQALTLAGIGGRINFFGGLPKDQPVIPFDSNLVHYKELLVTGTTGCSTGDCQRSAALLQTGKVDLSDLVSRRFSISQAVEAFAAAGDRTSLKVVIEPSQSGA